MPWWTLCILEVEVLRGLAPDLSTLLNLRHILSYTRASFSVFLTMLNLHGLMVSMKQTNT